MFNVEPSAIREQIRLGESGLVEFKASLRYDLEQQQVNKELPKVVAKTLAGFLNSRGGALLIGVADDRQILGIAPDIASLSRNDLDGFERALRTALANHLGVDLTPDIRVDFVEVDEAVIACAQCDRHHAPVFFRDGDRYEFYVRDGNATKPLHVQSAHEYIKGHWQGEPAITLEGVRDAVADAVREVREHPRLPQSVSDREEAEPDAASVPRRGERPPPWLTMSTRRVLQLFLDPLSRSRGWKRLYLVSPWISDITTNASITFEQILQRLRRDRATAYVVTRPPIEDWHAEAIARLGETGRANVALVPNLHTKLYSAQTAEGSFAMLGSANFTQQALINRELGLRVTGFGEGKRLIADLDYEAAQIYRIPDRTLAYQVRF